MAAGQVPSSGGCRDALRHLSRIGLAGTATRGSRWGRHERYQVPTSVQMDAFKAGMTCKVHPPELPRMLQCHFHQTIAAMIMAQLDSGLTTNPDYQPYPRTLNSSERLKTDVDVIQTSMQGTYD